MTGEESRSLTNAQRLRNSCRDDNGDTSLPTYFPWTQGAGSESQKVGKICGMLMRRKEVAKKQLAIVLDERGFAKKMLLTMYLCV